eukprot:jgi/Antlo1/2277/1877
MQRPLCGNALVERHAGLPLWPWQRSICVTHWDCFLQKIPERGLLQQQPDEAVENALCRTYRKRVPHSGSTVSRCTTSSCSSVKPGTRNISAPEWPSKSNLFRGHATERAPGRPSPSLNKSCQHFSLGFCAQASRKLLETEKNSHVYSSKATTVLPASPI